VCYLFNVYVLPFGIIINDDDDKNNTVVHSTPSQTLEQTTGLVKFSQKTGPTGGDV